VARKVSIFLSLILSLPFLFSLYLVFWLSGPQALQDKTLIIEKGQGIRQVAAELKNAGVIKDSLPLELFLLYFAKLEHRYVMPGEYEFSLGLSGKNIIDKFLKGERVVRKLTIPEGYTNFQIFSLISLTEALKGEFDRYQYKEGYLLPNTYHYYWGDSKQSLLDAMKQAMDKVIAQLNPADVNRILTLASIVEKEAKTDEERGLIASVYLNRMDIGMPLQADPTVIYAIYNGNTDYRHILSKTELSYPSLYNTYANKGLPPGPIANPGLASIKAVMQPNASKYLYFVADGNGKHRFAATLAEHNENVKLYRQAKSQ
jgi:UPF0755 protein